MILDKLHQLWCGLFFDHEWASYYGAPNRMGCECMNCGKKSKGIAVP